jgi:hypothetical protein
LPNVLKICHGSFRDTFLFAQQYRLRIKRSKQKVDSTLQLQFLKTSKFATCVRALVHSFAFYDGWLFGAFIYYLLGDSTTVPVANAFIDIIKFRNEPTMQVAQREGSTTITGLIASEAFAQIILPPALVSVPRTRRVGCLQCLPKFCELIALVQDPNMYPEFCITFAIQSRILLEDVRKNKTDKGVFMQNPSSEAYWLLYEKYFYQQCRRFIHEEVCDSVFERAVEYAPEEIRASLRSL